MIRNLPQKVFVTKYFLITVQLSWYLLNDLRKVDHGANNFSYLQDLKKIKELKEDFKMRCMKLHIAWSDGDSHDITLSGIKGSR